MDLARAHIEDVFRDVPPGQLELERDARLVIRTVLASGSWEQVSWLFETYGWQKIAAIVRADIEGLRTLPDSVRAFWAMAFFPDMEQQCSPGRDSAGGRREAEGLGASTLPTRVGPDPARRRGIRLRIARPG
jgi:hypothetical protein